LFGTGLLEEFNSKEVALERELDNLNQVLWGGASSPHCLTEIGFYLILDPSSHSIGNIPSSLDHEVLCLLSG
jgi:hypothetical protein